MFLIGMPGETTETILETSAFSGKLRYLVGKDWNIKNTQTFSIVFFGMFTE